MNKRLSILQLMLLVVALAAGYMMHYYSTAVPSSPTGAYMQHRDQIFWHTSGLSGGGAGCGIVAAACFACIVWIELSIYRKS